MKTKKHLDQLFKEQFKNFEVSPPPVVWENISAALQKKKKNRKIVPIWYKMAGVAALFLLFFSVGNYFFNNNISKTPITIEENNHNEVERTSPKLLDTDALVQKEKDTNPNSEKDLKKITPEEVQVSSTSDDKSLKENQGQKETYKTSKPKSKVNTTPLKENDVAITSENKKQKTSTPEKPSANTILEKEKTESAIAEKISKEIITTSPDKVDAEILETEIAVLEPKEENKKSIFDAIQEKEDALASTEKQTPDNRWEVSPNFAPVYYNSLNGGSSIDSQFSDNTKSGDVNYSYGVKVSYAVNKKLSVRTGINKVDLSYVTNDIEFSAASPTAALKSINYNTRGVIVAVGNRGTLNPPPSGTPTMADDGSIIVPRSGVIPGTMSQNLDYFEIPLELKYALLNKRFGLNMIGGLSTLILSANEISVNSDGFQTNIGEANNLNPLSFSTNVGLGFDYKITKKIVFNLEPMFKYQINAYTDSNIDFKPYYLGVYTGFSYRF
ncbi:MAG: hypothetical protein CVU03_11890 [Bacteroidetes bacterium HGW-Bacteroidetes-2]|jgi:hypothetical protein|nr:MAG: hypothetical protein CVU03_11890 [Bacteroidetes bacterium HGW-Bacteroidetes-2]